MINNAWAKSAGVGGGSFEHLIQYLRSKVEAHEDDDGKTSNGISNKGTSHSDQNKSRAGDGELNGKGTSGSGAGGASLNSNGNVVQNKSVKVCVIL